MDKSIRVRILDREYPLRVRADNEDRAREIAAAVDARLQSIRKQLPAEPDLTVAIMTALAYGEEAASIRESSDGERKRTSAQIHALVESLATVID